MARRLRVAVWVADESGEPRRYLPGDDVPAEVAARITNPRAWAEDVKPGLVPVNDAVTRLAQVEVVSPGELRSLAESEAPSPADTTPEAGAVPVQDEQPESVDYTAMTKADLLEEIRVRNEAGESIPTDGNKADLIDALELADKADEGEAGSDDSGEV